MSFYSVRAEIGTSPGLDDSIDSKLLCLKQVTLTLDQKVTQLFKQLRDPVYRYLMTVVGNSAEAEDITQDAFLQLYRYLYSGQAINNVRSWVFKVAHNLAINRSMNRKYLVNLDSAAWDELCRVSPGFSPTPEQTILQQENFERLQSALKQLSAQQRQCLILRAEGFRYKQIAEILRISASNVALSLHRGIRKMMRDTHE